MFLHTRTYICVYIEPTYVCILTRQDALRRWQRNQRPRATYGKLLELFVQAGCVECAEAVCKVLRKSSNERPLNQSTKATDQEIQYFEGTYILCQFDMYQALHMKIVCHY